MAEGGSKTMIGAMFISPGPAAYAMPQETGMKGKPPVGGNDLDVRKLYPPAYSLADRHDLKELVRSPGPGAYALPKGQGRKGVFTGKEYTLRSKPNDFKLDPQPGPGKYAPHNPATTNETRAPSYTMRPLHQDAIGKAQIPGANNYALPPLISKDISYSTPGMLQSSEKWSLTGRSEIGGFTQIIKGIPGPGAHRPEDTINKVREEAPKYSLRSRSFMPTGSTDVPGPKYSTRNTAAKAPRSVRGGTFGAKASAYMHVAIE